MIGISPVVIMAIVAVVSLIVSGFAAYSSKIAKDVANSAKTVVLQFKLELAQFQLSFMKELDERYVRSAERNKDLAVAGKEENTYRVATREKIQDLEIEVEKAGDSVLITLKDIIKLLEAGGRSKL